MKRKIIALILTLGLLLSCLPLTTIAESSAMVVAEDYSVTQGGYAYVYLRADNFVNVAALDIEIYYDSSAMSIHYTSNGTFLNSAQVSTNTATSGVIKISAMALNGLTSGTSTYNNRMMTICFKINSDCPVGDYPIVVTVGDAYDNDLNPTSISGVNGIVSVKQATAKSFPVYTTLSNANVEEADEFTLQAYHSSSSSYNFASADFTIEYDYELLKIKSIELDSKLLVEGAVYSINDSYPGMAIISYASTNAISCSNFFKVTFEVIANTDAQTNVKIIASDVYDNELIAYSPYTATSSTIFITEKEIVPDYPDLKLETEQFIVGKASDIYVVLEGNSQVAAADFAIEYDKDVFTINSVTADSNALSKGAMIVVNNNFSDGKIRFSYVKQNGDFTEDATLVKISLTPIASPSEHYALTPTGSDVCDISFKNVTLDYITDSDCIFLPTVVPPTCTEDGYTSYDCTCGEFYTTDPTPNLGGHTYGDFVVDLDPTCTEEGSKSRHCTVCGDKTDITAIEPTGHSHGDWVIDTEPTCIESGSAHKICGACGDIIDAVSELLLDSETYPESQHNYGNSIAETYNFSYPDAAALKLTFSSNTNTQANYDYIYIYDANRNLYGKYSGTELAGATINLDGNSFSIILTSNSYTTKYGFSFDSIVAVIEEDVIKPKGHTYPDEWTIDVPPTCTEAGTASKACYECGNVYSTFIEKLLDPETYPESQHSYANNIAEIYTFSYPDATALKLTFSSNTNTQANYDYIYIYDANGDLFGQYSGTELAGATINLEGNSFRIILTSNGYTTYYGFSFDSIVAIGEELESIKPTGHSYGDWVIDAEPTCTEKGSAHKICGACGDILDAVSELLLDPETYPESQHNYGNSISETYTFSYPDAAALKLTFSSSTKTETNRDVISIYDNSGNLYGKYSGTELAGTTITLEGNSFSIIFTTDVSVAYYGFSFDSIVAVIEDDVIHPKDHSYEIADVMEDHPHTVIYRCSRCGDEKTEPSVNSGCIDCVHIIGTGSTQIDYDNFLIFTPVQYCSNVNEIVELSENATVTLKASYEYGSLQLYGTGTVISVFVGDERISDFTLIVEGDVTGDSLCDVIDCAQVSKAVNGHEALDEIYALAADVNSDNAIDITDYQTIVNKALA